MSTWTHVVGVFRIDSLPSLEPNKLQHVKSVLGPMSTFEDYCDTKLPNGSEGSLQYLIHIYADGLPWAVVTVWGDLRDYDDTGAIEKWWGTTLEAIGNIRDAVCCVECNGVTKVLKGIE